MLTRRTLLKAGAAGGALLMAGPLGALARPLGPRGDFGTSRVSRLFPNTPLRAVHADMHNHTHLSDGSGSPVNAYESMRDAGLDVAALTDHSTFSWGATGAAFQQLCDVYDGEPHEGSSGDCRSLAGIDEAGWELTRQLADSANEDGRFTAIRGFEWSSPHLGHMNVWFSERWIDPLHTAGIDTSGLGEHFHANLPGLGGLLGGAVDTVGRANPAHTGMLPFYEWLQSDPATPVIGGGLDGLAGFNHPGRETGRFSHFRYAAALREQIVSMEILNRRDDYLFVSYPDGQPSPLVECLNAGWRVGLLGVTDEHGTDWGYPDGKGRAVLWVPELTRGGVREALTARRFAATFLRGLRLDATANGVQMGGSVPHDTGPVTFRVDIDRGPEWSGKALQVQVLRPGAVVPEVAHVEDVVVPAEDQPVIAFTVELDRMDGDWVVLRIADPEAPGNPEPGPANHPGNVGAVAYTSPFWLDA